MFSSYETNQITPNVEIQKQLFKISIQFRNVLYQKKIPNKWKTKHIHIYI